jgi:hypothetical protein
MIIREESQKALVLSVILFCVIVLKLNHFTVNLVVSSLKSELFEPIVGSESSIIQGNPGGS